MAGALPRGRRGRLARSVLGGTPPSARLAAGVDCFGTDAAAGQAGRSGDRETAAIGALDGQRGAGAYRFGPIALSEAGRTAAPLRMAATRRARPSGHQETG